MTCQQTPTATLFATSVISTFSGSTIVSTSLQTGIYDGITVISTCIPTVVSSSSTCVPTVYTTNVGGITTFTSLITTVLTVPVVQTVTTPTQTLYTTSCGAQSPDDPVKTPSSTTTTTTPRYVEPVTITRTFSSTDPSGNVIIATVATVSTPSPDSTQPSSGNGGPNTAVIGGAVGGVVGLLALIGIIWFIFKRRRGGRWDDIWEEDEGHQPGAPEVKYERPATADYGSSPNYGVVGSGIPSPLLRGDQPSGMHSHSRSTSTATGYATHGRSNSQTPFTMAALPPHSTPHSPPSLQQQPLPGAGAATPIWASPSAQQGYYYQGSPDPNFTPAVASTYNATTTAATTSSYTTPNPAVAYLPAASPPITAERHSTYNGDHKPPLEQSQHGAARQPSQYQQAGPSGSTTQLVHAPIDNSAKSELVAARPSSIHKGGLAEPPRPVEEAPPAYQQ